MGINTLNKEEASRKFVETVLKLENKGVISSRRQLAEVLDWRETLLSNAMNGARPVPKEKIIKLINTYRIEGFYDDDHPEDKKGDAPSPPDGVPMYDIPVSAGNLALIRDEPMTEAAFYLQIPSYRDCSFGARVSGDSMYPEIRNGDYVVCKEVETLIFGDIYLVMTHDGVETVKYVHPHPEREDWINLVAYNKSVPTTPLPRASIARVYKVKGVIKAY